MGCAPAYLALASEALDRGRDRGRASGRKSATGSSARRPPGSGKHQLERDPADLQRAIASPGGSTEAGLEALRAAGAPAAFRGAVVASLDRMSGKP